MKLETTKEFVMSAHQAACSDWKRKIEEEFPSLFEVKFEVGKWYIDNSDGVYMFQRIEKDSNLVFGFFKDEWSSIDDHWSWHDGYGKTRLATNTEIESMLWKEAENRGIGKDTKLEKPLTQIGDKCSNDGGFAIGYDINYDELWNLNGCIYSKGKWATPLDHNKEIKETIERLEKELKELKAKVK